MKDEKQPEQTQPANPGFIDDLLQILKGAQSGTDDKGKQFYKIDLQEITTRYLFHSAMMLASNVNSLSERVDEIVKDKILRDPEKIEKLSALVNEANGFAAKNLANLMPKPPPEEPKKESNIVKLDGKKY